VNSLQLSLELFPLLVRFALVFEVFVLSVLSSSTGARVAESSRPSLATSKNDCLC
jgi:hypothetical protein